MLGSQVSDVLIAILTHTAKPVNIHYNRFINLGGYMIIIYVAHPIGGDVLGNIQLVEIECSKIFSDRPEVVPIAPYLFALKFLDDNNPSDRLRGVMMNKEYFTRGFIDELWLFGSRLSAGMWEEVQWARELGIPVVPMTDETHLDLIRREIKVGDSIQIRVCGPGQEGVVTYLGESQKNEGAIKVKGPYNIQNLWWGDILYLVPIGQPIQSVKWNSMIYV